MSTSEVVGSRVVGHQGFDAGDDFGVFFRRWWSTGRAADPVDLDFVVEELPAAGGDRGRVNAEEGGDAAAALDRWRPANGRRWRSARMPLPLWGVRRSGVR